MGKICISALYLVLRQMIALKSGRTWCKNGMGDSKTRPTVGTAAAYSGEVYGALLNRMTQTDCQALLFAYLAVQSLP